MSSPSNTLYTNPSEDRIWGGSSAGQDKTQRKSHRGDILKVGFLYAGEQRVERVRTDDQQVDVLEEWAVHVGGFALIDGCVSTYHVPQNQCAACHGATRILIHICTDIHGVNTDGWRSETQKWRYMFPLESHQNHFPFWNHLQSYSNSSLFPVPNPCFLKSSFSFHTANYSNY